MLYNTNNMIYVLTMGISGDKKEFNFMYDLVRHAKVLDFEGRCFYCHIEHKTPSGSVNKIPFIV